MTQLYKTTLAALALFVTSGNVFSQDKIVLLNAKEIVNIKVLEITSETVMYQKLDDKSGDKKGIYRDKVFAVNYADGSEKVLYEADSTFDNFKPEQMRLFLRGTADARKYYHNYSSYGIGFLFAVPGVYLAYATFPVLLPFPAATGVFVGGMGSPNMNKQADVNKKYLNNVEYLMGYQRKARSKKTKHALIGALLGIGAGFAMHNYLKF